MRSCWSQEAVQERGSDLKTARAAAMEAKVSANELRRDKICDRLAQREKQRLQLKAAWLVALFSRTSFIVRVVSEVYHNHPEAPPVTTVLQAQEERITRMKRTYSSMIIQRSSVTSLIYLF